MRKLFSLKIDLDEVTLFERIRNHKNTKSDHGIYDIITAGEFLTGAFWIREKIVVLNEFNIYESGEPVSFFKVSRCIFSIQSITKKSLILTIDSSSKSIKPFLKSLEEAIQSKIFISQIKISLLELSTYIQNSENSRVKITHSYSSNQTITLHDKISFSIYSNENAILSAQRLIQDVPLEFERVKIESYQDGTAVVLDIKSNCLYSISTPNSKLEKSLIEFVIKTEAGD
ncbi:hypothetical protein KZH41_06735 [Pseudomonas sp. YeP6b]|uniref:hypothetical protein n=1 Tax=Pseudomonas sp. YeP6b TaxID=2861775 RepID=UPI0021D8859E|nr:hypothetical protein [Pseudomonas sp. YeP6b]UXZ23904.1 hypothetical protein KZH41_06735 [Pseudomonas sp. YeP6b]